MWKSFNLNKYQKILIGMLELKK